MNVSLEYLQSCSAQTGYAVLPLEKVIRLGEMAGDVARHPFLGNVLALKGGTGINLAEVAKRVPNSVICLVSALAFHELTTQIPHYVWVAVERKARKPMIEYPPVRVFHFSGKAFTSGIESHRIVHQTVQIYNAPKTIIDCFRWRKAVELDVAIEATREYLKRPDSSPAKLMEYAKICGMEKRVIPYLVAMTA